MTNQNFILPPSSTNRSASPKAELHASLRSEFANQRGSPLVGNSNALDHVLYSRHISIQDQVALGTPTAFLLHFAGLEESRLSAGIIDLELFRARGQDFVGKVQLAPVPSPSLHPAGLGLWSFTALISGQSLAVLVPLGSTCSGKCAVTFTRK